MLNVIYGDAWLLWNDKPWLCITTNGFVKNNGEAVMGAGIAKECVKRFPGMPRELGDAIKTGGNIVYVWSDRNLITFPVKHHWSEQADLDLIYKSCKQLKRKFDDGLIYGNAPVYLPKPGCGNGRLDWEKEVKHVVARTGLLRVSRLKFVDYWVN